MKRKLLALLLVLVMLVSVMPLAASATDGDEGATPPEHEHEHVYGDYTYDENRHSRTCTAENCGFVDAGDHSYENGTCTVCGYSPVDTASQHVHVFLYYDNDSGTTHTCDCQFCDYVTEEAHTFDDNGVCTVCRHGEQIAPHTHEWEESWQTDTFGHWHNCKTCGPNAKFEEGSGYGEHNGCRNKACTVCGIERCDFCPDANQDCHCDICNEEFEHVVSTTLSSDENNHWYQCACGSNKTNVAAHVDDNGDGRCDTCGYGTCNHDFTSDECWECEFCGSAHHVLTNMTSDENGHVRFCKCGKHHGEAEAHADYNGDNVCDICGWGCQHENAEWFYTASWHSLQCPTCGAILKDGWHNPDKKCSECPYDPAGCENGHDFPSEPTFVSESGGYKEYMCSRCHDFTFTCDCADEDLMWDITVDGHACYCEWCGKEHVAWAEHDPNKACEICGYAPCGNHVDGNKDHFCDTCGVRMTWCEPNEDCVCTICGEVCHNTEAVYVSPGVHRWICVNCDATFIYDRCTYNEDGVCWYCGHKADGSVADTDDTTTNGGGSSSDDDGLDNVPKTGDYTLMVLGMLAALGAGVVLSFKRRVA